MITAGLSIDARADVRQVREIELDARGSAHPANGA
jgi:hypothetical protein